MNTEVDDGRKNTTEQCPSMNRRRFVQVLLFVSTAFASVVTFGLVRRYRHQPLHTVDGIAQALREHFSYLRLDEAGLARFARDYAAERGPAYADENLFTIFLLSSSFFKNNADESRLITYDGLYDPYAGCVNPFAEFD
jgi:hypothetical protein